MKKEIVPLLLIVGVVFVSGCIGQTKTTGAAKGLSIQSFSPDFEEVRSGEEITLSALIENVGEADATGISVQLFGLNFNEWNLQGDNPKKQSILRKADPTQDMPGESYEFNWNLQSPPNLRVDNTYTANIRTYYKYQTSAVATLRFMSYDYIKSLPADEFEKAKKSAGVVQSTVSSAPISASINVGSRPLIVYSDGDTYSVQLTITNVGNGNPFKLNADYPGYGGPLDSSDLYYVDVDIDTDLDLDCSNTLDTAKSGELRLTRGTSKTLFCTATIPSVEDLGNTKDYTVTVNLNYGYYTDASTKIKVLKAEYVGEPTPTTEWVCDDNDFCDDVDECAPAPPGQDVSCRSYADCNDDKCCCYREV